MFNLKVKDAEVSNDFKSMFFSDMKFFQIQIKWFFCRTKVNIWLSQCGKTKIKATEMRPQMILFGSLYVNYEFYLECQRESSWILLEFYL